MSSDQTPSTAPRVAAIVAVAAVLILVVSAFAWWLLDRSDAPSVMEHVKQDRYQAVYLDDQRVYFGQLEADGGEWLVLRNAFFLRRASADAKAARTDLVPLSQEIGGDGSVILNPDSVVQVQNLQARSEIARTIEDALG